MHFRHRSPETSQDKAPDKNESQADSRCGADRTQPAGAVGACGSRGRPALRLSRGPAGSACRDAHRASRAPGECGVRSRLVHGVLHRRPVHSARPYQRARDQRYTRRDRPDRRHHRVDRRRLCPRPAPEVGHDQGGHRAPRSDSRHRGFDGDRCRDPHHRPRPRRRRGLDHRRARRRSRFHDQLHRRPR